MGLTKTDIFTEKQNTAATMAKVLGHPARIAIIQHLLTVCTCICGDIVNEIGLSQPTISQHLRELKNVGIIKGNIEGRKMCYCIDHDVLDKIKMTLENQIFNFKTIKKTSC